ncbi:MAG: hypothetical protein KGN16_10375 [Burkholderiales bacterium]|nr:hypothetical protein [Burkholderiales bacterium]
MSQFDVLVAQLLGKRLPRLPAIRGRVFKAPPVVDADPLAVELEQVPIWRALARAGEQGGGT